MVTGEGGASCTRLLQAIVTKYIQLSSDELAEWQADPEGYVRSMDVETSPDADTPRPCGVALLVCMLDRNKDTVAQSMLALAAQLQAAPPTPENVLIREACYRAIGEAYSHLSKQVDFPGWYSNELRALLTAAPVAPDAAAAAAGGGGASDASLLQAQILRARALWLVGVCGGDLPADMWRDAYGLMAVQLSDADLVVALTTVSSLMVASVSVMEEERMYERRKELRQAAAWRAGGQSETADMADDAPESPELQAAGERLRWRKLAVEEHAQTALAGCFALVARLAEAESVVRVLQLVSVVVEVSGERIEPLFPLFASALPQIWVAAQQQAGSEAGSGSLARLHSALIATLTHLVSRLGQLAMGDAGMQSVLYPLLQFATSTSVGEGEVLVDEALRLWAVAMTAAPNVTHALQELLPNLIRILSRGRDNSTVLAILEAYLLLGGPSTLEPHLEALAAAAHKIVSPVAATLSEGPSTPGLAISAEPAADLQSVAGLLAVMQQLGMDQALAAMEPTVKGMMQIIASHTFGMVGASERVTGVADAFLEALAPILLQRPNALGALLPSEEAQASFVSHWLALASTRYLEELFGVQAIASLARYRRHVSAAAMCALIASGACSPILELGRGARVLALGLRAVEDSSLFQADHAALQQALSKMDASSAAHNSVEARRAALQLADPARAVDAMAALKAAVGVLVARHGQEAVLAALEEIDPEYKESMVELMSSA